MSESQRRIQLITRVAKGLHPSIKVAAEMLRKKRPQLFHGVKSKSDCTKDGPTSIYVPIKNEQDVEDLRNSMACGNYPLSMTDCEVIGINGDCGSRCPVLLRDECEYQDEMLDAYFEDKDNE